MLFFIASDNAYTIIAVATKCVLLNKQCARTCNRHFGCDLLITRLLLAG